MLESIRQFFKRLFNPTVEILSNGQTPFVIGDATLATIQMNKPTDRIVVIATDIEFVGGKPQSEPRVKMHLLYPGECRIIMPLVPPAGTETINVTLVSATNARIGKSRSFTIHL